MKKIVFALLLFAGFNSLEAQYYYKDLVSNAQVVADMKAYKADKIKKIVLKSFEDNGAESEGFFCKKELNKDFTKSELYTRAAISAPSLFTSTFDKEGKLLKLWRQWN